MDLLNLLSTLRRHKIIVSLVFVFIVAGCAYVVLGIPPQYQSQVQYVLIEPPPLPTDDQLKANPSLTKLNTNNPYLRLPNPSIVVDVLAQRVSADGVRNDLIAKGADKDYTIAATDEIGSGLVIQVTGTGHSVAGSTKTLDLVVERMKSELHNMQTIDGASERYLFQALPVSPPTPPTRKVTGTMRSLIAVGAAGIVLLFAAISFAEAVGPRKKKRPQAPARQLPSAGEAGAAVDRKNGETDLTVVLPRLVDGLGESAREKSARD